MTIQKTTSFIDGIPRELAHDVAHFPPGALLLGRYRLGAPIGRGGMGIVYRADDLKIGQRVALKFLSPRLEHDPARVARLVAEVRLGRRVAHPNVCRLYDIAEAGSHHFIVMELVEGEDLGSLLDRIGRLSPDKALGVARDICAGLAAAHDQGIVHRDLKPGNVMIDSRGRARITDFGLAATLEDLPQRHSIMGTLGYMAPEQLRGEATPATDVYALGVLLYEMVAGQQPFQVSSIFEMPAQAPPPVSAFVEDIDPRIESLIARCLAADPAGRPPNARAVLEALPRPDVLDAAMEAGETPPPEVVAAAGASGRISPLVAASLVLTTIVCTAVAVTSFARKAPGRLLAQLPSPQVMHERVVAFADRVAPGRDRARPEWFGYRAENEWTAWTPAAAMRFWYRRGATPSYMRTITFDDPPHNHGGAISIEVDGAGHLRRYRYTPRGEERTSVTVADLFAEAGLDAAKFAPGPLPPIELPPVAADRMEGWQERGGSMLVLAGTTRGQPVFFEVWKDPKAFPVEVPWSAPVVIFIGLALFIFVGAAVLARRNLNSGRGDMRGASRLALFISVLWLGCWLLVASPDKYHEAVAWSVYTGMLVWLIYVAVEPHVRRRWPRTLVSWNRLLQGRFGDPLVARDLLIGLAAAAVARAIVAVASRVVRDETPRDALALPAGREMIGELLYDAAFAVVLTLAFLFLIYAVTLVVRKRIIALIVVIVFLGAVFLAEASTALAGIIAVFVVLHRFGLLAAIATLYGLYLHGSMITFDFTRWYGPDSLVAMLIMAALMLWAVLHLLPIRRFRPY